MKAKDRSDQFCHLWSLLAPNQPQPEREYRFAPPRRWRFDCAWPALGVAVEIEGVVFSGKGRHQTAKGLEADCEKYNTATLLGWRLLRFTQVDLRNEPAWVVESVTTLLAQQRKRLEAA